MLRRVENLLLDLAVVAIVGLGVLITASVLLRAVFNSNIPDTIVIVRELMVVAIILPLAVATQDRAHIVVEFLSNMMPSRVQDWLIVGGSVFGLFALSPLIYAGWREVTHTIDSGAFFFGELSLPKWPGRVVFLVGISFCWLQLLLMVVGDMRTIRAGGSVNSPDRELEESL